MIDPASVGTSIPPTGFSWTERDTILYALGVGADATTLAYVTENSHGVPQRVLPTYGVIAGDPSRALALLPGIDLKDVVHGSQSVRITRPLPPAGSVVVSAGVESLFDKGPGGNAIVNLISEARDAATGDLVVSTASTVVVRGGGGLGGESGTRPVPIDIPDRAPDAEVAHRTTASQALLYRLSGDRNPLHSDPWFATERAGFERPILHGLCTYGFAGRALLSTLCADDDARFTSMSARFTAPVIPGDELVTSIWETSAGAAVFRTVARDPAAGAARVVLDDGRCEFAPR